MAKELQETLDELGACLRGEKQAGDQTVQKLASRASALAEEAFRRERPGAAEE